MIAGVSKALVFNRETLALTWRQFAGWWVSELRQSVPATWRPLFDGKTMPTVFIWVNGNSIACKLQVDGKIVQQDFTALDFDLTRLLGWLAQCGFGRDQVLLTPVLSEDLFLRRNIIVPSEAFAALPQILDQEIVRRTPFQLSQIWHAAHPTANRANRGAVSLCQWIISRDRARGALASLAVPMDEFDRLAARSPSGELTSVVSLRTDAHSDTAWVSRLIGSLAAALLVTMLLGVLVFEWWQAGLASDLETAMLEARAGVQQGKSRSSQLAQLYAAKADSKSLAIWDELSRILPDDTFLTEFRISQGSMSISGYSSQAAHLVRIVDQSPMFAGATLISAIIPDSNEGKDRFSVKFHMRKASFMRSPDRRPEQ